MEVIPIKNLHSEYEIKVRVLILLILFFFKLSSLTAQNDKAVKNKLFNFSIAPSLGTNGLHPGSFNNYITINLTSGYSRSSLLFELGTISNLNTNRTNGLQISGLTNITGGNSFAELTKKEKEEKINSGFTPSLSGGQFSGISNIVLGDVYGAQFTGGVNLSKGALIGLQISGISNIVHKYSFGVQLSGVFNVSQYSFSGLQIAALSNYTQGQMAGVQLGAVNNAGNIYGINSYDKSQPTGLQIGLVNIAENMDGYQFGIINIAKKSQGTQIGLINFYKGGKQSETKDGTSIGLLNFGDLTYLSVYANEIYALNYEISTGNRKNARIHRTKKNVYITNSLIYSHNPYTSDHFSFGYGLKRLIFNRSALPGQTESKFLGYGLEIKYVKFKEENEQVNYDLDLDLLCALKIMAGKRIAPKLYGFNWYTELSLNGFLTNGDNTIKTDILSSTAQLQNTKIEFWPGLTIGFLLH